MFDGVIEIPLPGAVRQGRCNPARGRKAFTEPRPFVVGPENRLVEAAVRCVLDRAKPRWNPLVFCGPSGSGKSHLALGLAGVWKDQFPDKRVVCVTAIDLARELAEAIETQTADDFSSLYRRASLLVMEDLDYLADKAAAQQELLSTLDTLIGTGSWIILTARRVPSRLRGIVPRLRSRLSGGLIVPMALPAAAARLRIVQQLAESRQLELSEAAANILAQSLTTPVPELIGALVELAAAADAHGRMVDAGEAEHYIWRRHCGEEPSLHQIALRTARYYCLPLSELRGPSRCRAVVTARGLAIYLARKLTRRSFQQIGSYFGGRDHTTTSHAYRKTQDRLDSEPAIRQAVLHLQERLLCPSKPAHADARYKEAVVSLLDKGTKWNIN